MNAIFHIDESENWKITLANVQNMLAYAKQTEQKFFIEVLVNSIAVKQLKKDATASSGINGPLMELLKNDVDIVACRNALNLYEIEAQELISGVRIVPAGVVELVVKQNEGFAYIKP
ncbi:MAG: DsrE family protein [Firmicutes bacterium]|nr:DsrE family protein [Bacillota bacterium]